MATDHVALSRRLFEEAWNHGNVAVVDELVARDCLIHDPAAPEGTRGPEFLKENLTRYRSAFPDLRVEVEDVIAQGDKIVLRWSAHGTQRGELFGMPPSNREGDVTGITIQRFKGNKVVETWTDWDRLGMMERIGAIPEMAGRRR